MKRTKEKRLLKKCIPLIAIIISLFTITTMGAFSINDTYALITTSAHTDTAPAFELVDIQVSPVTYRGSTHQVRKIAYSNRPRSESIVVVLLADGFRAEYQDDFLNHARDATTTMMNTHPFSLFSHLFTVYAVQVISRNIVPGLSRTLCPNDINFPNSFEFIMPDYDYINYRVGNAIGINSNWSYFGARFLNTLGGISEQVYGPNPNLLMPTAGRNLARQIAYRAAGGAANLDMVQVIGNPLIAERFSTSAGRAWIPTTQTNVDRTVGLAFTMACNATNSTWQGVPAWHGTFIHEFGHSFGWLVDNHNNIDDNTEFNNQRANITNNITNLKWHHWLGHRQVANTPYYAGTHNNQRWYVPSRFSRNDQGSLTGGGCIMVASHVSRYFNGVATAELIRRMASISGETFNVIPERVPFPSGANNEASATTAPPFPPILAPGQAFPVLIRENYKNRILDSAFHGNTYLEGLIIPQSITSIGDFAFLGAINLRTIQNMATIPQRINETTFAASGVTNGVPNQLDRSRIVVHIPAGTYMAYRSAGWTGFILVDPAYEFNAARIVTEGLINPIMRITEASVTLSHVGTGINGIIEIPSYAASDRISWFLTLNAAFSVNSSIDRVPVTMIGQLHGFVGTGVVVPKGIRNIASNAFVGTNPNLRIFARASGYHQAGWASGFSGGRAVYFYSAEQPTEAGRFWRMVDGVPRVWGASVAMISFDAMWDGAGYIEGRERYLGDEFGTMPNLYGMRNGERLRFDGWWTEPSGGMRVWSHYKVAMAGEMTLYARWSALIPMTRPI